MYLREPRDVTSRWFQAGSYRSPKVLHRKDEADVESLVDLMENSWLNPICPEDAEIVSLSTGTVDPTDVAKDLRGAHQLGEAA